MVTASRCSRKEKKKDPFKIIYRSNTIQFDEMGYPLRLCIVTGNGRVNAEQVWLDTLEEDGDVVLEFKKMESEAEWKDSLNDYYVSIYGTTGPEKLIQFVRNVEKHNFIKEHEAEWI